MIPTHDTLTALVAKWREAGYGWCADELEAAALAVAPQPNTFALTRKSAVYVLGILTERDRRDHACPRCVGPENVVGWPGTEGFICVKHRISDWLEGAVAPQPPHAPDKKDQ